MKNKNLQIKKSVPCSLFPVPCSLFISLFSFFFSLSLHASPFGMILVGDPILDDIAYLSTESGNTFLSFTPPLAPGEVEIFINSIDTEKLSYAGIAAYTRVKDRLVPHAPLTLESNNFALLLNIDSSIEGRIRFNTDIDWQPLYPKIAPALSFPLRLHYSDSIQLYFEPFIGADPEYYQEAKTFGTNIPLGLENTLDLTFPLRAFIAAGGSWWSFQLGRDRLSFGTGHTGNLAISDNPDYYDFARLSLFSKYVKYSVLINQLPLKLNEGMYRIPASWEREPESEYLIQTTQRYYYLHRLDFNLFNKVSISLMEGLMAGNSPLELRFLNPAMLFHSMFTWYNYDTWKEGADNKMINGHIVGSLLSIEISWNIIPSLSLYGQFVMNEFATGHERKINPEQPPNALGYMAGVNFSLPVNSWGSDYFIEFIYTDPFVYMLSSPFASFIHMRQLGWSQRYEYRYIGYPRDTIALTAGARFFNNDSLILKGNFSWISKGEHVQGNFIWDWNYGSPYNQEKTPSGKALNLYIAAFEAKWKINKYFTAGGGLMVIFTDYTETGGQASLSCRFFY